MPPTPPLTPAQTVVRAWRLWLYWRGAVAMGATSLLGWAHYELWLVHPEMYRLPGRPAAPAAAPSRTGLPLHRSWSLPRRDSHVRARRAGRVRAAAGSRAGVADGATWARARTCLSAGDLVAFALLAKLPAAMGELPVSPTTRLRGGRAPAASAAVIML
ncbi:hypothetical protein T492DRAFT_845202 [Pavlovales sp. CCMP2436]|nr:hypothetical protein T492DRAFT_845202 [Pavlovales sp. CCMP2436]